MQYDPKDKNKDTEYFLNYSDPKSDKCYTPLMWPFSKKDPDGKPKRRRVLKRVIVGFIIGGAISSIIGKSILKERRKEHLGEDRAE